jgi:hypothetical protein
VAGRGAEIEAADLPARVIAAVDRVEARTGAVAHREEGARRPGAIETVATVVDPARGEPISPVAAKAGC